MGAHSRWTGVAAIVLAVVLLAGATRVLAARERRFPEPVGAADTVYLTSGTAVRRMTGAFSTLAADLYWIRAIQYYGGTHRRLEHAPLAGPPTAADDYHELYTLLDLTTTLDPRFNIAYRFGATFLAEPFPNGPGRPDLAIKLLEKGLKARPDKWEYLEDIGFVHYWYTHDYVKAAAAFQQAAQVPGAPWWLKSVAATTLEQGGDRRTSRLMWQAILQSSEVEYQRRDAERRLEQLRALDDIDALQAAVDRYRAQTGTTPSNWMPIARAHRWRGVPVDPTGTAYQLTAEGRVELSPASSLSPLPAEPGKASAR